MAASAAILQDRIFSKLKISLEGQKSQAAFCCGGSSKINDKISKPDIQFKEAPPVVLHWASEDRQPVQKIIFSQDASRTDDLKTHIQDLTKSCQPASFGKEGKAVMDESYRKATKLDSTCFTTNFHPHDHGILQDIERVLLPAFDKGLKADGTSFVQAELYKLNVYSGPGGKFKAHVDTPRGQEQFGSLVVCLPSAHQGGALAVRHNGREISFDWGSEDPKTIEWAAFFSDCEHEVGEVISGHRVTLTYNLYTACASILRHLTSTDVESFPLYHEVKAALANKAFLAKGGKVGFFCNHFYAQNNEQAPRILPQGLKGIDMIIYAVCCALGLSTRVRPIMDNPFPTYNFDKSDDDSDDESDTGIAYHGEIGDHGSATHFIHCPTQTQLSNIPAKEKIRYTSERDGNAADVAHRTFNRVEKLVGRKFQKFDWHDEAVDDDGPERFMEHLWLHDVESIYWVTEVRQKEAAVAFATYGNEPGMSCKYSAAAILVDVPAWNEHRGKVQWLKRI